MADITPPAGITADQLLADFRTIQSNPTATVDDMFASVMGRNLLAAVFDTFKAAYDLTVSDIQSTVATINAKLAMGATFVSSSILSTADLLATYPASASVVGKYARVNDLYGSVDDVLRCRYDGTAYRWVPQREAFSGSSATTSGVINIVPLVTPPVLDLTATATGNITANLSTTNAYIGQTQIIRSRGVLGLFNITLAGLIGGATLPLLQGGDRTVVYTAAGWKG